MFEIGSMEFAVRATIRIMKLLADRDRPLSVLEAARALDLKYDTARCCLAALENERFVKAVGDKFEPGDSPAILWDRYKADLVSMIERMENKKSKPDEYPVIINLADRRVVRRKIKKHIPSTVNLNKRATGMISVSGI